MGEQSRVSNLVRFTKGAVDRQRRLAYGYLIVCSKRNAEGAYEPYFDRDRDFPEHITEECMSEALTEFAKSGDRKMGVMHKSANGSEATDPRDVVRKGTVVHTFPLTREAAVALKLNPEMTGALVAVEPDDDETLDMIDRGELASFSMGGERVEGYVESTKRKLVYEKAAT